MPTIDLNCDFGENFGAYDLGTDERILQYVTSVNIACGFHAGDAKTMRETVAMAAAANIGIGAHPGYPDLGGFGRRFMELSPQEIYDLVIYQIGALQGFAVTAGTNVRHVKPHGALYNTAAGNRQVADAIAQAVKDIDKNLILFGLSGGSLIEAGEAVGLQTASEVFGDRTYQPDGSLTPRREANALIVDQEQAVEQVLGMVNGGKVKTTSDTEIPIKADTICIHGDGPHAFEFAKRINERLSNNGSNIHTVFSE